jgi:hypothetical protein
MLAFGGVALTGSVGAIGMAALQALANQSGTMVASVNIIVATGVLGVTGMVGFGALWLVRNISRG